MLQANLSAESIMSTLTVTDVAAWWGAVVATLALAWSILLHLRTRPRLVVELRSHEALVNFTVVNRGDKSTTLTRGEFAQYDNRVRRLLRRPSQCIDVNESRAGGSDRLPIRIQARNMWTGRFFTESWVTMYRPPAVVELVLHVASRRRPYRLKVERVLDLNELAERILKAGSKRKRESKGPDE